MIPSSENSTCAALDFLLLRVCLCFSVVENQTFNILREMETSKVCIKHLATRGYPLYLETMFSAKLQQGRMPLGVTSEYSFLGSLGWVCNLS